MTTVTFLGASGGCGTTTLVAVTRVLRGVGAPQPGDPDAALISAELIDGGRYSASRAATAVATGVLVLVGAPTPAGLAAHEDAGRDAAARFGALATVRIIPVLCASFGPRWPAADSARVRIPFDGALAPGGPVAAAVDRLHRVTRQVVEQEWLPALREGVHRTHS